MERAPNPNQFQQQESRDARAGLDPPTPPPLSCVSARFETRFCHFHIAVSQHLAHGLVPEVFSDEIPFYTFRHLRVSYWTSACVRDCLSIAETWSDVFCVFLEAGPT
jgi:hypothetical protein